MQTVINNFVSRQTNRAALAARIGLVCLLHLAHAAYAQTVGEIEFARGVGFSQSTGQNPRTLGKGLALQEGDRLTTAGGGLAIARLNDGTRFTIRPNSELVIQQYQFNANANDNNMVMQLLRGGFRAITGLISKSSPDAARVQTKTATIGIRGTDFDARICTTDCKTESARITEKPRLNTVLASAKVVSTQGSEISAVDSSGERRNLVEGGSIYPGDVMETGPNSRAILAFRDDSRMTLGASTRFKVDSFVFDEKNPNDGKFLVSLLRGSLRALTGLIGKANHRNVGFTTATATIGIRGTGLDLDCTGEEAACSFFTWLGSIEVTPNGQSALQVLQAGQGLFVSPTSIRPLGESTLNNLPRPDSVPVNVQQLFTGGAVDDGTEGLFVFVRDGHIEIKSTNDILHLGKGETGFAGNDGTAIRPLALPRFIEYDRIPMPNAKSPMLGTILGETGVRSPNQCK